MRYTLLVTGPPYGTQNASSALLFTRALMKVGHRLESIFFYHEGVLNANQLSTPDSNEMDIVREWTKLHEKSGVILNICVAAALRRGIINAQEAARLRLENFNLQPGFKLSSLSALSEAVLNCNRLVQF